MPRRTLEQRFWEKVDRGGPDECWAWTGGGPPSYGRFGIGGRTHLAHRVAYELMVGPIPDGLDIDHLCRNKVCVNPAHLEPVPHAVNVRRGPKPKPSHCKRGHEFNQANTYFKNDGGRQCRACDRQRRQESKQ